MMSNVFIRRIVSVSLVVLATVVLTVLAPLALVVCAVHDLVTRARWKWCRLYLFLLGFLWWEMFAVVSTPILWVASGFGWRLSAPVFQRAHAWIQVEWMKSITWLMEHLLGFRFEFHGFDEVRPGPVIVLARHSSIADVLLPALPLIEAGLGLRFVLKRELLAVPSLDIFGHRLPNHFVDRSGADTEGELARLQQLAAEMGPDEGLVIFPEGTRFSAEKRERAINRVERTDPVLAARMRRLRHVMPPRAGGTAALLAGAPDAGLVLFLHHGMEGLREVRDVVALVPLDRPITITARRIPRSEVDEENLGDWLLDLWEGVDTWVQEQYELSEDELTQAAVTQAAVTQAASPQAGSRQDGAGHAASPLPPPSVTDG